MGILLFLQDLRFPVLDKIMLALTTFGEETALLVVALIVFWCIDKKRGYYILTVGFIGSITNQFMKLLFRVDRPWIREPRLKAVKGSVEGAGGYSFPSGHSQSSVGLFGALGVTGKRNWLKILCIAICLITPFSRLYLGVHTPEDVIVGSLQSVILLAAIYPLIYKFEGKLIPWALAGQIFISFGYVLYVENLDAAHLDPVNLESGMKNAYTLFGCTIGLMITWLADQKLNFDTKCIWWGQLLKIGIGLILVLAVKEGLRGPLELIIGDVLLARAARYFLIVIVAGVIWPLAFRYFPKTDTE